MTRIVGALITALLVLCGLTTSAHATVLVQPEPSKTYTYDVPLYISPGDGAAPELGHLVVGSDQGAYDVIDHWPRGGLVRLAAGEAPSFRTHSCSTILGRDAQVTGTTMRDVVPADESTSPVRRSVVATDTAIPAIKPGAAGGPTAGNPFPASVRAQALEENPSTCVYCHMDTDTPQVDHAVPRVLGGDATIENAQTTCAFCNGSKGPRPLPVNPPPGYVGPFPPPWWPELGAG